MYFLLLHKYNLLVKINFFKYANMSNFINKIHQILYAYLKAIILDTAYHHFKRDLKDCTRETN